MRIILLDMVWPALYVSETFWRFWFLIIGTIVIETFVIKFFLKFSWSKSFLISLIGNSVSGIIGTFVMMWAMLLWHAAVDNFVPKATFDPINWVATYILMCIGSVFLETLTIKLLFKESIKRLFLPMLTGNVLSYSFIAFVMITGYNIDNTVTRAEDIKYLSNKQHFTLLDSSTMKIDTATMRLSFDKNNKCLNDSIGYILNIPFQKQDENSFQFNFTIQGDSYDAGIGDKGKTFHFSKLQDTYQILLEQKNSDKSIGWMKPIITDTIVFRRITQ